MAQFTPSGQQFPKSGDDVQMQILSELKAIRELLAVKTQERVTSVAGEIASRAAVAAVEARENAISAQRRALRVMGHAGPELELHNQSSGRQLIKEMQAVREDGKALLTAIMKTQQRMLDVIKKWDDRGLPGSEHIT